MIATFDNTLNDSTTYNAGRMSTETDSNETSFLESAGAYSVQKMSHASTLCTDMEETT